MFPYAIVQPREKSSWFIYAVIDGKMWFYWYTRNDDKLHHKLVCYGTSQRKPMRFTQRKKINQHIKMMYQNPRWSNIKFKVAFYNDFDEIGLAVSDGN